MTISALNLMKISEASYKTYDEFKSSLPAGVEVLWYTDDSSHAFNLYCVHSQGDCCVVISGSLPINTIQGLADAIVNLDILSTKSLSGLISGAEGNVSRGSYNGMASYLTKYKNQKGQTLVEYLKEKKASGNIYVTGHSLGASMV